MFSAFGWLVTGRLNRRLRKLDMAIFSFHVVRGLDFPVRIVRWRRSARSVTVCSMICPASLSWSCIVFLFCISFDRSALSAGYLPLRSFSSLQTSDSSLQHWAPYDSLLSRRALKLLASPADATRASAACAASGRFSTLHILYFSHNLDFSHFLPLATLVPWHWVSRLRFASIGCLASVRSSVSPGRADALMA